ncbi:NirA family protein [Rhodopseudomonas sp. B29]|uniref:NirA family protein n=1 Tax=Rhodopseudomonas sp. B29 TaxID=95607 RepID=UPI0004CFBFE3|nr:NirA family protein [Rhodopseudomonas sp. B29]
MGSEFTGDQKRYLQGFASGLTAARAARGTLPAGGSAKPSGPDAIHLEAQDRVVAAGKKLSEQEKWKRDEHPFDAYARLKQQAKANAAPKPADNFRWRYYGLFYVAPAQTSYMCRLRIPNGVLSSWQMAGLADIADNYAGGYSHVTTRANLQMREIEPKNAVKLIEGIESLGLWSRGSGADNIRNVTGSATAGIDPQELLDTRAYAREWHFHILNERTLFGLPRKFNVAFDGGGLIPTLEDTNDIAFQAVQIGDGHGAAPGVWFRLALGGITGHKDFARDTGVMVPPDEATEVADAIIRVFIEHGDRTDRNKSRLKYVLDAFGFDKFLGLVEERLGRKLLRVPAEAAQPRPAQDRSAHIGVHKQKQDGLNWIGLRLPLGKLTSAQMRGLAEIARSFGDGDIRLTVWQNLLVSGVADARVVEATAAILALGLAIDASPLRAGLIACTGATGCRFGAAQTKETAEAIAQWCEPRVTLDTPINIHVTGCHNTCAQHYIGDIGLIGARVAISDEDSVNGFHIHVGGAFGERAAIGTEVLRDVKQEDAPRVIEHMLSVYLAQRHSSAESFLDFTRRHDAAALKQMFAREPETTA